MLAARIEGFYLINFCISGLLCVITAINYEILSYVNVISHMTDSGVERSITAQNRSTP